MDLIGKSNYKFHANLNGKGITDKKEIWKIAKPLFLDKPKFINKVK